MKKNIYILILILLILTILIVIFLNSNLEINKKSKDENKIYITTTLFPQYDFAREIGKEKVEVSLLLPFGTESHSYDPTPNDIISINNSDLLIYTGNEIEPWASKIISSLPSSVNVLDASLNISLNHENEHHIVHEGCDEHHHTHEADPHIWMDPDNACKMIQNILDKLILLDPKNKDYYTTNATNYIAEITNLNEDFKNIAINKQIVFGSPFSYSYFVNKYNLEYITVYESCSETVEPSLIKIKSIIDEINETNINYILCEPLSSNMIAKTISYETNTKILPFYSIHNISKKDFENGETYLSLMKKNLESIKLATN